MLRKSLFVAALLATATLTAQVASRITGSVVDASGAAVADATVNVYVHGGNAPILTTKTTNEGLFEIPSVRPDVYDVTIQAAGFTEARVNSVTVETAKSTAVPAITLQVSSTAQTLEVTDTSGAQLQTANAEITNTLSHTQLETLPVLDRQVST